MATILAVFIFMTIYFVRTAQFLQICRMLDIDPETLVEGSTLMFHVSAIVMVVCVCILHLHK